MAKLIHTMIRVHDLDASLKFYREVFNLTPSHRLDFPDFALVYLRNEENDAEIELTWNKGRETPYTHGDGYGHVAVVVDMQVLHLVNNPSTMALREEQATLRSENEGLKAQLAAVQSGEGGGMGTSIMTSVALFISGMR